MKRNIASEAQMQAFGRKLAPMLDRGDCVLLKGDLGAGKTTLARAVIRARAGAEIDVPSPTFALVEGYDFDIPLYHVDLYRLDDPNHAVELGLEDLFDLGIILVEWPERAAALMPAERLELEITHGEDSVRNLTLTPRGKTWTQRAERLMEDL